MALEAVGRVPVNDSCSFCLLIALLANYVPCYCPAMLVVAMQDDFPVRCTPVTLVSFGLAGN